MTHRIEQRLQALNLTLPQVPVHAASDAAWKCCAGWLVVGGQLPMANGRVITGRIGDDCDLQAGATAARQGALAVLAQIRQALMGDWSRFDQLARITVQVNAAPGSCDPDPIAKAASEVFLAVLGDCGTHARTVFAVNALPRGALVQIDAVARITPQGQPIGLFP
ncbi:RidA family protein [Fertoebacter nigrum]|uniref:RidA family protein n=1 Tax=Fertoeibacter niger TaxID=2656921 RepID=A0A8X8H2I9_9RHOB|nr:RidA family protein [Fertoeibacter niger]NUB45925.1 RidA family protein [Fertoeibacter niger]